MQRIPFHTVGISALVLFGAVAPAAAEVEQTETTRDGYSVSFRDDPLDARGADVKGWVIRVLPVGWNTNLMRPRTHFVPELLKSVDNM